MPAPTSTVAEPMVLPPVNPAPAITSVMSPAPPPVTSSQVKPPVALSYERKKSSVGAFVVSKSTASMVPSVISPPSMDVPSVELRLTLPPNVTNPPPLKPVPGLTVKESFTNSALLIDWPNSENSPDALGRVYTRSAERSPTSMFP